MSGQSLCSTVQSSQLNVSDHISDHDVYASVALPKRQITPGLPTTRRPTSTPTSSGSAQQPACTPGGEPV